MYVYIYINMYIHMHVYMHILLYMRIYIYIYVHINMYTHRDVNYYTVREAMLLQCKGYRDTIAKYWDPNKF